MERAIDLLNQTMNAVHEEVTKAAQSGDKRKVKRLETIQGRLYRVSFLLRKER